MGAAGIGIELEEGAQRLMPRLGARGLAHMHDSTIAALSVHGLAQRIPAVVDTLRFELQAQRVHEVIRQDADEQMPFDACQVPAGYKPA